MIAHTNEYELSLFFVCRSKGQESVKSVRCRVLTEAPITRCGARKKCDRSAADKGSNCSNVTCNKVDTIHVDVIESIVELSQTLEYLMIQIIRGLSWIIVNKNILNFQAVSGYKVQCTKLECTAVFKKSNSIPCEFCFPLRN